MEVKTYSCDICNTQKKDANHWWKVFLLDQDITNINLGFMVVQWQVGQISKPISRADVLPTDADAHICGAACLMEWISKHGLKIKS